MLLLTLLTHFYGTRIWFLVVWVIVGLSGFLFLVVFVYEVGDCETHCGIFGWVGFDRRFVIDVRCCSRLRS